MASRSDYLGFHLKRDWRREGGNWREAAQEGAPSESEEGTSTGLASLLTSSEGAAVSPGPWQSPGPEQPGGGPREVSLDGVGRAAHGHPQTIQQHSDPAAYLHPLPAWRPEARDGWDGGASPRRCGGDSAPGQPPCLSAARGALASTRTPPSPACVDTCFPSPSPCPVPCLVRTPSHPSAPSVETV